MTRPESVWEKLPTMSEEDKALTRFVRNGGKSPMPVHTAPVVHLTPAASIRPEPIDWYWNGWLARGKLHILAGAPGCGKTTIAIALAATGTNGGRWPDGTRALVGNVLIWSGEDDPTDTLAPRLLACGADMSRVFFVGSVRDGDGLRPFDPATDMQGLSDAIQRVGGVSLLVVDPVVSAVTGDSHKNTEVRRALQPLVDLGMQAGCAVLGISHFSKGTVGRDPTERVTGSIAFGALARVVLAAAKLPDDGEQAGGRILCRSKSNIGPDDGGFGYSLEQTELRDYPGVFASRVLWGEPLDGSARELLAEADRESDTDEREEESEVDSWLRELLTEALEASKAEVMKAARASGYAERTVQRARKRIGAKVQTIGFGKDKHAVWSLPNRDTHSCHPKNSGMNGTTGTNDYPRGLQESAEESIVPFAPVVPRFQSGTNGGTNDEPPAWVSRAGLEDF